MLVVIVEDEHLLLESSVRTVSEALPCAEIRSFLYPVDALKFIQERPDKPDIVFSDIEMPGMDGITFALRVKNESPETKIIFVTAFPQYAVDAFRVRASGYLIKPLKKEDVLEEISQLNLTYVTDPDKLEIRCFGRFEVFYKGRPLKFRRRQTKELLAFLIDGNGSICTPEEAAIAIWETEDDIKAEKNRLRQLISDMRKTFAEIGMEHVLIRGNGTMAIDRNLVDCDYFRFLDGDITAINQYRGEYMTQYSWAELTSSALYFSHGS